MNPEYSIPTSNLPGYTFTQISNSLIEVKYEFPSNTTENNVDFTYNRDSNSIYFALKGQDYPILCGILCHPVNTVSTSYSESKYIITLEVDSNEENTWNLLVNAPSKKGIDPKSVFLLGADANNNRKYDEAFELISASASEGYTPAMEILADIYSSEESPYKEHYNIDNSIDTLNKLFESTEDPNHGMRLASIYRTLKRPEEAKDVLTKCADKSKDAKLMLAFMLSPLTGELDEPEKAVELLRDLSNEHVPEATSVLINHLEKGVGATSDEKEIKKLRTELRDIQRKNLLSKYKNVFIGLAIAAAACATIAGIKLIKKRRNNNK
ncbi:hypothetical protein M9Y10_014378 [Tritrichomonas musculus]|uniref:CS domain-containing protein n=1 Tax=Tritrichomonas musculus TaxID=1915356 RepID=A0ABR2L066_9EUKA